MRKTLLALLLVTVTLTGCSQQEARTIFATDRAVSMFEQRHGTMTTEDRHGYLDNAYQACTYLDTNPSLPDLWTAMTDSGISSDAAATTIEAAITYLCTEHKGLLA